MTSRKVLAHKLIGYLWPLVALALMLGLAAPPAQAQTSVAPAGAGTAANPYQVTQLGNLVWMSVNVYTQGVAGKYYKLMNDIDASATANWNDNGTTTSLVGFAPIGVASIDAFHGAFDGQGHAVRGLVINRPTMADVGLFGLVGMGGSVSNLAVVGGTVKGKSEVGCLAGANSGTITNCSGTAATRSRIALQPALSRRQAGIQWAVLSGRTAMARSRTATRLAEQQALMRSAAWSGSTGVRSQTATQPARLRASPLDFTTCL